MVHIGIDLGTTNSLVSICKDGKPKLIPNALGDFMTPSVVSFDEVNHDILIGKAAKQRLVSHPKQTIAAFKRAMGSHSEFVLGKKIFTAIELSALLLKQLKQDAEAFLGSDITEAVISVPAYFSDAQRNATKLAGEMAGLKVERLINEPTAAALAYDMANKQDENLFVVIDLGGGTLDVSILDIFDKVIEVRASAGDNFLGGEDFSIAMVDAFLSEHTLNAKALNKQTYSQLCARIDALKHKLSSQNEASLNIDINGKAYTWILSKDAFVNLVKPLIKRFVKPIERALRDSRIAINEIDNIVLVGGATRMSWVRSDVSKLFKRLPDTSIHPDHVVALGASVQAALKAKDAAFDDLVLTDVCPYTLGVGVSVELARNQYESGYFLPVIERNCTVPISREKPLQTVRDNQTLINCHIYQGESRLTKNNVWLGSVEAKVPRGKAGEQGVTVRFTYDINGILEVIIKIKSSGESYRGFINNESANMSKEEIEASLSKLEGLKIHPRENAENAELIARLDRLYEESLSEKRECVADLSRQFEILLDKQDADEIAQSRQQIANVADELEQY